MSEPYQPYGPEWEKELMKLPKAVLISMLKKAYLEKQVPLQPPPTLHPETFPPSFPPTGPFSPGPFHRN